MERISDQPVVDRKEYPSMILFIDKEGYVAAAERKKAMTPAEKAAKDAERKAVRQKKSAVGKKLRTKISEAKKQLRKECTVEAAQKVKTAEEDYKEFKSNK